MVLVFVAFRSPLTQPELSAPAQAHTQTHMHTNTDPRTACFLSRTISLWIFGPPRCSSCVTWQGRRVECSAQKATRSEIVRVLVCASAVTQSCVHVCACASFNRWQCTAVQTRAAGSENTTALPQVPSSSSYRSRSSAVVPVDSSGLPLSSILHLNFPFSDYGFTFAPLLSSSPQAVCFGCLPRLVHTLSPRIRHHLQSEARGKSGLFSLVHVQCPSTV